MKTLGFVQLGLLALAVVAAACEPERTLEEVLQNKQCRGAERACVEGYHCDGNNICVRDNAGGGSGGTSSQGGAGGMPPVAANGGSVGVGAGGTSGSGGGTAQGGSGGSAGTSIDLPDGGVPLDAGGDGCVPGPLYIDIDGDGYGSGAQVDVGCAHDNLVQNDDDCYDVDEEPMTLIQGETVHPGQTEYFIVGYRDTSKPDNRSFDYDCSGAEEADDTNTPPGPLPDCASFSLMDCSGTGFIPDDRRPDGNGIISVCGVENVAICGISGGICAETQNGATDFLFRCR